MLILRAFISHLVVVDSILGSILKLVPLSSGIQVLDCLFLIAGPDKSHLAGNIINLKHILNLFERITSLIEFGRVICQLNWGNGSLLMHYRSREHH